MICLKIIKYNKFFRKSKHSLKIIFIPKKKDQIFPKNFKNFKTNIIVQIYNPKKPKNKFQNKFNT